jgi:hypothetical protein
LAAEEKTTKTAINKVKNNIFSWLEDKFRYWIINFLLWFIGWSKRGVCELWEIWRKLLAKWDVMSGFESWEETIYAFNSANFAFNNRIRQLFINVNRGIPHLYEWSLIWYG